MCIIFYWVLAYAPASKVALITNTGPILVIIMSAIFLGTSIKLSQFGIMIIAFSGIVLLCVSRTETGHEYKHQNTAILMTIFPALGYATAMISVRLMAEELNWVYPLFYNGLGPVFGILICYVVSPSYIRSYSLKEGLELSLVGAMEVLFQLCLIFSFKYVKPNQVAHISYLNILYMFLIDVIFFGYRFQLLEFLAFLIILSSIIAVQYIKP